MILVESSSWPRFIIYNTKPLLTPAVQLRRHLRPRYIALGDQTDDAGCAEADFACPPSIPSLSAEVAVPSPGGEVGKYNISLLMSCYGIV